MTQTVPLAHLASTKPSAAESSSRKTLGALALAVAKAKRIVVVTGAGISCSSGIPDFRSSDGLYNLVKSRYPDAVLKGRDLFDAALFRDPTSSAVFYTFMAELKTQIDSARPAPVHDFLATLDAKGKLLRSYTQNIDGLEERAGLRTGEVNPLGGVGGPLRPKNVQLHGDIHRVRCTLCSASFACTSEHIDQFRTGTPPDCPECTARSDARTARAARALKCGTLRPAIVLYDEPHPLGDHIGAVQTSDLGKKPDLLIVMGTSLKVHGLRRLVKSFAKAVHSSRPSPAPTTTHSLLHNVVFVNRTAPPPGEWTGIIDYHVQGDADTWVAQVLGEWKKCRPADWEVQATLDGVGVGRLGAPGTDGKPGAGSGKAVGGTDRAKAGVEKGKGKEGTLKKGKAKSKAGVENTPPEDDPRPTSSQQPRCVIVLPRSTKFKAGTMKSPLKATMSPLKTRTTALKARAGVVKASGRPCQLGMASPQRLGGGGLKRPAPSPLAPRQTRLDAVFRSPAARTLAGVGAGSGSSTGTSGTDDSSGTPVTDDSSRTPTTDDSSGTPTTDDSSLPSSSSSSTSLVTSALSSRVELELATSKPASATSSQASTSHDSVFSSQTVTSSQASSVDLGSGSQTKVGSSSQPSLSLNSQSAFSSSSQSALSSGSQATLFERYLGQPRSPPFRRSVPAFGPGSEWLPQPQPRRATTIPIPGRDYIVSNGQKFNSALSSQVSLAPPPEPSQSLLTLPASSQSLLALPELSQSSKRYVGAIKSPGDVPRPCYWDEGNPRKKGRLSEERDEGGETEDEGERDIARGLLFSKGKEVPSSKGKEVPFSNDKEVDVIDLDPDDDDDSMSLDGAVGHMSLDGPGDIDTDMEPEPELEPQPVVTRMAPLPPVSPVQTRAKKRAKEKEAITTKKATKRAPKPRVPGTRVSMRLTAKAAT